MDDLNELFSRIELHLVSTIPGMCPALVLLEFIFKYVIGVVLGDARHDREVIGEQIELLFT